MLGALQGLHDRGEPFLVPGAVMGLYDPEPDIRAALPEAQFDAAFEEGRRWPREDAVTTAIELTINI